MQVKCKWPNVWTSVGQIFEGQTSADLPEDEAKTLVKIGAAEAKRGRKKPDEGQTDAQ